MGFFQKIIDGLKKTKERIDWLNRINAFKLKTIPGYIPDEKYI